MADLRVAASSRNLFYGSGQRDGWQVGDLSLDYDDIDKRRPGTSSGELDQVMSPEERVRRMVEMKGMRLLGDESRWREAVRLQMERELNDRVRQALETPPSERQKKRSKLLEELRIKSEDPNSHLFKDGLSRHGYNMVRWDTPHKTLTSHPGRAQETMFSMTRELFQPNSGYVQSGINKDRNSSDCLSVHSSPVLLQSNHQQGQKQRLRPMTKTTYIRMLRSGDIPRGISVVGNGEAYKDLFGVLRNSDGPFWPVELIPLFATPRFKWWIDVTPEPLQTSCINNSQTVDSQVTKFTGRWRGTHVTYDSERSLREQTPLPVPEDCCPTLMFESRFECGNLRHVRRVGQFEYELLLQCDLYTTHHTQWFYFKVTNAIPGLTYKFKIINLLKKDSLYNYGMRPLIYSEHDAREKQIGWVRTGHHISYTRNVNSYNHPLLNKTGSYHTLEWQMEFSNHDDTCYLAHCYPYSFTDLKEDLDLLVNCEIRSKVTRREVLCETEAGNSCFVLTVTNFDIPEEHKKAVIVTARVHPGETQSSWMMKGLLEFVTGPDSLAQTLRNKFLFKIVPMINPDGVIVGNYRCSLAGRDLNRNYRHPRQESFPTIWYIKNMTVELSKRLEIMLYCDLHGHSRKPNVFMYGNNSSKESQHCSQSLARALIDERLFPYIMSVKSPDKFHLQSCKFQVRRCKESTGRVVMWRQLGVANSFTMEATFSGTVMDRDKGRHFNIRDFLDMGRSLAEAALEYASVMEDSVIYTRTVIGLTNVLAEQLAAFRHPSNPRSHSRHTSGSKAKVTKNQQGSNEHSARLEAVPSSTELSARSRSRKQPYPEKRQLNSDNIQQYPDHRQQHSESKSQYPKNVQEYEDIPDRLQVARGDSVNDCISYLAQLDVSGLLEESNSSSDSDSESEAELKESRLKRRKKRRKSKRMRERLEDTKRPTSIEKKKAEDNRVKSALPSLNATHQANNSLHVPLHNQDLAFWNTKQSGPDRLRPLPVYPQFVNKYQGRHNGGFPCFTEERILERAAKRYVDQSQKTPDSSSNEINLNVPEEEDQPQPMDGRNLRPSCRSLTPGIGRDLIIKTGYTHADALQDAYLNRSPQDSYPIRSLSEGDVNPMVDTSKSQEQKEQRPTYSRNSSRVTLVPINRAEDHQYPEPKDRQDLLLYPLSVRRNPYQQTNYFPGHLPLQAKSYSTAQSFPLLKTSPPLETCISATALKISTLLKEPDYLD